MEKIFIPIVLGTGREDRESLKVADFIFGEITKQKHIESEIIDVLSFQSSVTRRKHPIFDGWKEIAGKADGFVLVFPEYNHSFPGELKILLDSLMKEYEKKPVALCGVSSGRLGGSRGVESIKPVLTELKMVVIPQALYFSNISELFDDEGNISDHSYGQRAGKLFESLTWYARTLKYGRENISPENSGE